MQNVWQQFDERSHFSLNPENAKRTIGKFVGILVFKTYWSNPLPEQRHMLNTPDSVFDRLDAELDGIVLVDGGWFSKLGVAI